MIDHIEASTIFEHLRGYGLRRFQTKTCGDGHDVAEDEYWQWARKQTARKTQKKWGVLCDGFSSLEKITWEEHQALYDFIADHDVFEIHHSMKFEGIALSGLAMRRAIGEVGSMIDFGCNVGYLTTYYARELPEARVYGIDISDPSIALAAKIAQEKGISNVRFLSGVPPYAEIVEPVEALVETQSLNQAGGDPSTILQALLPHCSDDALLVSIPSLGNIPLLETYVEQVAACKWAPRTIGFLSYKDMGSTPASYPILVFKRGGTPEPFDLSENQRLRLNAWLLRHLGLGLLSPYAPEIFTVVIDPLSAASQAGLQIGDAILSVEGESLATHEVEKFRELITSRDELKFHIRRGDQEFAVSMPVPASARSS